MTKICEVAIVGAGPNGLSLAAHLRARGTEYRVFGRAMDSWAQHMPIGMMLKSDGFVSNLSSPAPNTSLKAWCAANRVAYADEGYPVPLTDFVAYSRWFQSTQVPDLDERNVAEVSRDAMSFVLTLEDGEVVRARHVVLAAGITWYTHTPSVFTPLSRDVLSHSYDHRDVGRFKGCEVGIVGAGASAMNLADALREAGAQPHIIARCDALEFNRLPDPADETFLRRLQSPPSGIGRGWKSYFCAYAPLMFHRLPRHLKDRAIRSHTHAAGGFFMRDKVEGVIPASLGRIVLSAAMKDGRAELRLAKKSGGEELRVFDHVTAATGYVPDFRRLPFLAKDLAERAAGDGLPQVSDVFETKVPGLYALGLSAMPSFGPLMRFMMGSQFAAPHLASHLNKLATRTATRRAA